MLHQQLQFGKPALRSANRRPWGILQKCVDFSLFSGYNIKAYHASVAQSVVHLTRNEKVACSSQVTSSIKTAVFAKKTAVFLTFWGNLKGPQNGLALIWRYFFEGFKFLKNRDFEKPDFPNFFEVFHFW